MMPHSTEVPSEIVGKWQEIVNLLAEIIHVPSALIMRVEPPNIKVFVSSESKANPYEPNEVASLNTGLYCETVMNTRKPLLVPDALIDEVWKSNPDIKLGMISYLGVPIVWPDGEIFGTICVLDNKGNAYSEVYLRLLLQWREVVQADLRWLAALRGELTEREAKIRRLVESNIIGIFTWELEGPILEANEAFLRIVGYDREALVSGLIRWTDLTPPEYHELDALGLAELKNTGTVHAFEKEYFRRDGSRVPVLVGAASFGERGNQGVAFVLDLTERKRAEAELRETERRYSEVQMELAHANRLAIVGQLTASIAHEVKQPLAATVANATAGLRWLDGRSPNLEEVRQALTRIVKDGNRSTEVIDRIRALIKRAPPRRERLEVNGAIREVIELTRGEALKNGVSVQVELANDLPLVLGDRVELQQVLLNLVVNAVEAMSGTNEGTRRLLINSNVESGGVCVSVVDSGPGLAPETIDRLFEAFYTTKPGGLGLGLCICRSIIEAHGGQLWASANMARGTTFQFTVPAHPDNAAPRP
jgi:PAS domain S-box-containing protein